MNATLEKFGYPGGLIREYRHWAVVLRPAQPTLGALVLGATSGATAFSDLPAEAFAELQHAIADIETGLRNFRPYDRINYLMLMMVDPHVHFHVVPRYAAAQTYGDTSFPDAGWPGTPDLKTITPLPDGQMISLRDDLKASWPES